MILGRILFYSGLFLLATGVICTFALILEPAFRAADIVFRRRRDHVFYESKEGKAVLERSYTTIKSGIALLIVTGTVLMLTGMFLMKTGSDASGEENTDGNGPAAAVSPVTSEAEGYDHVISITGLTVYFDGIETENGADGFVSTAESIGRGEKILLIDDFAASGTYHTVRETLSRYALNYTESK